MALCGQMVFFSISLLLALENTLACGGKDVNRIAEVLMAVGDWTGLATELDIELGEQTKIKSNCKQQEDDIAGCYRRKMVQTYCDSTGLEVEEVAENIAQALEFVKHKKQAKEIRKLNLKSGKSAPEPERPSVLEDNQGSTGPTNGKHAEKHRQETMVLDALSVIEYNSLVLLILAASAVVVIVIIAICMYPKGTRSALMAPVDLDTNDMQRCGGRPAPIAKIASSKPDPVSVQEPLRRRPQPNTSIDFNDPVFNDKVTGPQLIFFEYHDENGKIKEMRIKQVIAPHWADLASLLGFGNAEISTIKMGYQQLPLQCTHQMLMQWMGRDINHTWKKLITNMKKVQQLRVAAAELATALRNRIVESD